MHSRAVGKQLKQLRYKGRNLHSKLAQELGY